MAKREKVDFGVKKKKIEIEWKLLQKIAGYYEFPSAVFFGNPEMFKHKTRNQALRKKAELFDKIRELIEYGGV